MMNSKKLPSGNLNSNEIKARINQSFEGLYEIVSDKKMQEFITNLYNDYNGSPGLTFARDLLVLNYHNQIADDNWKASDTIKLKDFIQSEVERKVIHCQSTFNFIVENIKNTNLIHTSEAHYERCLTKLRTLSNTLTVVSYKAIVEELIISQLSIRRPLNQKKLDNFTEQELVTSFNSDSFSRIDVCDLLRSELKRNNLITAISKGDFNKLFRVRNNNTTSFESQPKINWIGQIGEFRYFISKLAKDLEIKEIWNVADNLVSYNGESYEWSKQKNSGKQPNKKLVIDNILASIR